MTSQIGAVWLPLCGAFTGDPVAGLKETVLLNSSADAELTDATMASQMGQQLMDGFKPTGVNYKLAIRLTGKFPTAFPAGNPGETGSNQTEKANGTLKGSATPTTVVLFGDSDSAGG